ncbi:MAG: FTR1 family protein [Oculatellaceae cyanobacterium bins.114]|nr:FTR1 family protein [Oculatellaceae cyanobacterium bins.114]
MDIAAALPTFVITLREGVEAALVVGIVLAYLQKAGQQRLNSWVYSGIGVGVGASVLIGVVFLLLLRLLEEASQSYAPVMKQFFEGGFSVAAIALLSWMLIWMTQQARALKADIEGVVTTTLSQENGAGWGVFGLIAIAVLREGFETVLFIAAQFQSGWLPVMGAIAGLVGAVIIGIALFQLGVKINLRRFFQVMGVLLLLIVSGLVVSALRHFDTAIHGLAQLDPQWAEVCPDPTGSCILGPQVWNLSGVLPDRQFPGVILKAFFGYTQTLYLAQAIDYVVFLAIVGGIYWQSIRGHKSKGVKEKSSVA